MRQRFSRSKGDSLLHEARHKEKPTSVLKTLDRFGNLSVLQISRSFRTSSSSYLKKKSTLGVITEKNYELPGTKSAEKQDDY